MPLRIPFRKIVFLGLFLGIVLCTPSLAMAQAPKEKFICSPWGRDCDKQVFDQPGTCPHCNMELIKQAENVNEKKAGKVAILLFDGVQIIDFTGPYEVLGQAGYQVITISANPSVTTNMGMKVTSDFTFSNCPEAGIFIIPGGSISRTRKSAETI